MPLTQPLGLLGLLGALPVIALYLLRRQTRREEVPSVLLFRELGEDPAYRSFLRRLMRERSLLAQLLAIGLISLALAGPYTVAETGGGTAVVVDGSASMDGYFDEARSVSAEHVEGETTLVLAGSSPIEMLSRGSPDRAREFVGGLEALDTEADLAAAMELAEQRGANRVVVVSDFLGWRGRSPADAAESMESSGVDVVFESVGEPGSNAGFVDGSLEGGRLRLRVARFGGAAGDLSYSARRDSETVERGSVYVAPGSSSGFVVGNLSHGELVVKLDDGGRVFDDTAYAYVPGDGEDVLVVDGDGAEARALEATGASVTVGGFGDPFEGFDMVVVSDYSGTDFERLRGYLEGGGRVVLMGTPGVTGVPDDLLPIYPGEVVDRSASLSPAGTGLTDGAGFGEVSVSRYVSTEGREGSTVHVETGREEPVVAEAAVSSGEVYYVGLPSIDGWNDFSFRRGYPVFWTNLMEGGRRSGMVRTGERVDLGREVSVDTPSGDVSTGRLFLDSAGFYRWNGGTLGANLFSAVESDTTDRLVEASRFGPEEVPEARGEERTDYTPLVLLLLAAVVLYEAKSWRDGA